MAARWNQSTRMRVASGRGEDYARLEMGKKGAPARPSALLDTRVIYCGDCVEQLRDMVLNDEKERTKDAL